MEQKTVFISYRRALSKHLARSIYMDLRANGWDVFLDVNTIDSGDFDRIILNQIGARAHFVLLISPGSLERCANPGDWVLREIAEAVRLERNIVPIVEEGADFEREISCLPADLRAVISRKNALPLMHFYFDAAVEMLRSRFLKTAAAISITAPPPAEHAEVQRRMAAVTADAPALTSSASAALMPAPFDWIEIPGKGYYIARYPVTNAQFRVFIDAGGYQESHWWTNAGWQRRKTETWTEPRFWRDTTWNTPDQPVVGVSWYEAVAFCLWLSRSMGEQIMLPTQAQWRYAAQGDDGRHYPWGNEWDNTHCNHNVNRQGIGKTTPVQQFEGRGDSPFGVVDMAGNVWEWCLTEYVGKKNDVNSTATERVLHGGSWNSFNYGSFRCDNNLRHFPSYRDYGIGFRLSRT